MSITRLFMKIVGFWHVETPRERLLLRVAFGYAVWAIVFAILVEGVDLYHCMGDFYVSDGPYDRFFRATFRGDPGIR